MLDFVVKRGGLPEPSSRLALVFLQCSRYQVLARAASTPHACRWFFQQLISAVDYLHKMVGHLPPAICSL